MATPQEDPIKPDIMDLGSSGGEGEVDAAADAAQPAVTPEVADIPDGEHDGNLVISDEQESFVATNSKGRSFASSALSRTFAVLLLSSIVWGGWKLAPKEEKRVIAEKVPTDHEEVTQTLQDVKEAATRLSEEWSTASGTVSDAFAVMYSIQPRDKKLGRKPFPSVVSTFVDKLEALSPPEDTASKSERLQYGLRIMLLQSVIQAAEVRLKQLKELETFINQHASCRVYHLSNFGMELRLRDVDMTDGSTSFPEFTRELEAQGFEGVTMNGDEESHVPSVLANRLIEAVRARKIIESADAGVLEKYQKFVASAERAQGELEDEEKEEIDNLQVVTNERPFPVPRFKRHVMRAEMRMKEQHLTPGEVLTWQQRWNPIGVQNLILAQENAQTAAMYIEGDLRDAALNGWNDDDKGDPKSQHLLDFAVGLL